MVSEKLPADGEYFGEIQAEMETEEFQIREAKRRPDIFRQVILYVLDKVGDKENVGEKVLHKLLYFIDFDYYEKFEESLMGERYIRNIHGPTSTSLNRELNHMVENGEIERTESLYYGYSQKRCRLKKGKPDLRSLSPREIEHIDEVLGRLSAMNGNEIEMYSHGDIPWRCVQQGETIPYESVFYRDEKYSVREYEDAL